MGPAVAAQLQSRRGLHHAGSHTGHIALGNLAALGIQHAVPNNQRAVAGDHGAGTDDAVGGYLHVVHLALCGIVDHNGRAVACKIIDAIAGEIELRILDGIDGIAANIQTVQANLVGLIGSVFHLGIGDVAGNLRIGMLCHIELAVQHIHGFHSGEWRCLGRTAAGESGTGLAGLYICTGNGAGMLRGTAGRRAGLELCSHRASKFVYPRAAGHGRHIAGTARTRTGHIAHRRHHVDFFRLVHGTFQNGHAVCRNLCLNGVHKYPSFK